MAVIGIDLGTTYSAAARCVDGAPEIIHLEGEATLPSVVGLQKNGKIAIGKTAKRNQAKFPHNTVVEVKRQMGKDVQVLLGNKPFSPPEISAMLLRKIKELAEAELGEEVTGAVISCPAYFLDPQRQATKEAGEIAGLNVLRIINEPTAAAYAYGLQHGAKDEEALFVVYDLGGGTFDVTVIRMTAGQLEVIGTGGDPQLGGGNFDDRIVDWMLDHLAAKNPEYMGTLNDVKRQALRMRLKVDAEEAKKELCKSKANQQVRIGQVDVYQGKPIAFDETLTMECFEGLIADLLKNSLKWVEEALKVPKEKHEYTEGHLTAILLVGGSTRVPLVRQALQERFPTTEIWGEERGINPDEIVALGASMVAAEVDPENDEVSPWDLVDVTGHTLSVAVFDDRRQREVLHPLVPKDTTIPCSAAHQFSSKGEGQDTCKIKVFQGKGIEIDPEQVTMIGEFLIRIAPIQAPTTLSIGLNLNEDGILVAHATDESSGQKVECQINYKGGAKVRLDDLAKRKAQFDSQLNAVIGQTANPLDETAQARGDQEPTRPATAPPVVVTDQMNGIMLSLYNKAINSFDRVPPDRQGAVAQLVTEIEDAARRGDQARLSGYCPQLSKLLEGVA